ncbi:MAG: B12-binding domain-containing radical SAM protein, partial [Desulfobacca sp.]|nr:B12-binding domain-containing radical SAM protein [Desulfobacca sp.]
MKLVLIQPPIQDFYDTAIRLQPLGLAYLKAAVKKHFPEWEVVIKDFHQGWGRRTITLPKDLAYLKDYYPWPDQSPFSLFHHYYHFGASFETIAREVAQEKPDLVGISSLFSPYYREVLQCAEAIKDRTDCPIVIGGSHVSAVPEMMLQHPKVDWVIRGEGERPLVELIKARQQGRGLEKVPNLGYKQEGRLIFNPLGDSYPLAELPFPDFSDFGQELYRYEKRPLCFILTSRGCPHQCSFCSVHRTFPRYHRRSPQSVVEEMKLRHQEGYRVFDFEDDNLTYNREEMITLCQTIIQTFPVREIECLAMNGISYQSLDSELLVLMKAAGFTHLNLSLVSADPLIREKTFRTQGMEQYLQVVREAARLGFKIVSYQILGLPDESLDSMVRTLCLNAELPVLLGASPFYLTPGTPISGRFSKPTEEDIFKARLTAMAIESDHFQREELYTLFVTTRIINFIKGLRFEDDSLRIEEALRLAREQG